VDGFSEFIKYPGKIVNSYENNYYFRLLLMKDTKYIDSLQKKYKNKNINFYENSILYDEKKLNLFIKHLKLFGFDYNKDYLLQLTNIYITEITDVEKYTLITLLFGSFDKIPNNDISNLISLSLSNSNCIKFILAYIHFILEYTKDLNNNIINLQELQNLLSQYKNSLIEGGSKSYKIETFILFTITLVSSIISSIR
jgi:hypothetical protein